MLGASESVKGPGLRQNTGFIPTELPGTIGCVKELEAFKLVFPEVLFIGSWMVAEESTPRGVSEPEEELIRSMGKEKVRLEGGGVDEEEARIFSPLLEIKNDSCERWLLKVVLLE